LPLYTCNPADFAVVAVLTVVAVGLDLSIPPASIDKKG